MKTYGEVDIQLHVFLTSAQDGGERSASCPGCYTTGRKDPGSFWIGGWVGPIVSLDAVERREVRSLPLPGIELWSSSP